MAEFNPKDPAFVEQISLAVSVGKQLFIDGKPIPKDADALDEISLAMSRGQKISDNAGGFKEGYSQSMKDMATRRKELAGNITPENVIPKIIGNVGREGVELATGIPALAQQVAENVGPKVYGAIESLSGSIGKTKVDKFLRGETPTIESTPIQGIGLPSGADIGSSAAFGTEMLLPVGELIGDIDTSKGALSTAKQFGGNVLEQIVASPVNTALYFSALRGLGKSAANAAMKVVKNKGFDKAMQYVDRTLDATSPMNVARGVSSRVIDPKETENIFRPVTEWINKEGELPYTFTSDMPAAHAKLDLERRRLLGEELPGVKKGDITSDYVLRGKTNREILRSAGEIGKKLIDDAADIESGLGDLRMVKAFDGKEVFDIPESLANEMRKSNIIVKAADGTFEVAQSAVAKTNLQKAMSVWKQMVLTQPGWVLGNIIGDITFGTLQDPKFVLNLNKARKLINEYGPALDELPPIIKGTIQKDIVDSVKSGKDVTWPEKILKNALPDAIKQSPGRTAAVSISGGLGAGAAGFVVGGPVGAVIGALVGAGSAPIIAPLNEYLGTITRTASYITKLEKDVMPILKRVERMGPKEKISRFNTDTEKLGKLLSISPDKLEGMEVGKLIDEFGSMKELVGRAKSAKTLVENSSIQSRHAAAKEVERFFYDYGKAQENSLVATVLPFWRYMDHSTQLFLTLPIHRPKTVAMYSNAMRAAKIEDITNPPSLSSEGDVIATGLMKKYGIFGEAGIPKYQQYQRPISFGDFYVSLGSKNPFGFQADLIGNLATAFKSNLNADILGPLSSELGFSASAAPAVQFAQTVSGINPRTGKKYTMPPFESTYGTDITRDNEKVLREVPSGINPVEAAARYAIPGYAKMGTLLFNSYPYSGQSYITMLLNPKSKYYMSNFDITSSPEQMLKQIAKDESVDNNIKRGRMAAVVRTLTGIPVYGKREEEPSTKEMKTALDYKIAESEDLMNKLPTKDISGRGQYQLIINELKKMKAQIERQ